MGTALAGFGRKALAWVIVLAAAWLLLKVVVGVVTAVAWIVVAVLALVAVAWAVRVLA